MELPAYIETIGDEAAARLFKVKPRTAQSWRYKYRTPRPKKAQFIEKITKGKVTVAECYTGLAS